jgi:hypothetical protein
VEEFPTERSFVYCNMQKKSIWGLCSNQEKNKGEIVDSILNILSPKDVTTTQIENGYLDLKTIYNKIKENTPYVYGTLSGSPIEFGVPMLPKKDLTSNFVYVTEFDISEAKRIEAKINSRSERYKEFHITKEIAVKNTKKILMKIYDLNAPSIQVGWNIMNEKNEPSSAEEIASLFMQIRKSEKSSILINGGRGTGKFLLFLCFLILVIFFYFF